MTVRITNLVKRYNELLAVDHLNLNIDEGEIFGLLGPNGAGKTSVINAIMGLIGIDGGEIKIFDKSLNDFEREIKKSIGIVPQDIAVFEDLTAYENLAFFGKLYQLRGDLLKKRVEEALHFTGLWERRKEFPKKYSGGMKRRLNIACALVHQPKLIIMDEPTVGIDPQSRKHIIESVKTLNQKGSTIIYTSHYMEEVEELCTRIAIMDHGRIIALGTKEELTSLIGLEEKVVLGLASVNYTLVDKIKKVAGVKDCVVTDHQITVISERDKGNLGRIIDCVSDSESEVLSIHMEKPTLEGVFLTLTGRSLRD